MAAALIKLLGWFISSALGYLTLAAIAGFAVFVACNKSRKLTSKSIAKKVSHAKKLSNELENNPEDEKLNEKQQKAVKSLKRRIGRAFWFNHDLKLENKYLEKNPEIDNYGTTLTSIMDEYLVKKKNSKTHYSYTLGNYYNENKPKIQTDKHTKKQEKKEARKLKRLNSKNKTVAPEFETLEEANQTPELVVVNKPSVKPSTSETLEDEFLDKGMFD